jgi:predicted DNA-binding transcriptional regulator AlpA
MLTLDEVAAIAACSLAHLRREIDAGRGPDIVRIGSRAVRVTVADAVAWIDQLALRPLKTKPAADAIKQSD